MTAERLRGLALIAIGLADLTDSSDLRTASSFLTERRCESGGGCHEQRP